MKIRVETVELTKKVYFVEIEDGSPAVWACASKDWKISYS